MGPGRCPAPTAEEARPVRAYDSPVSLPPVCLCRQSPAPARQGGAPADITGLALYQAGSDVQRFRPGQGDEPLAIVCPVRERPQLRLRRNVRARRHGHDGTWPLAFIDGKASALRNDLPAFTNVRLCDVPLAAGYHEHRFCLCWRDVKFFVRVIKGKPTLGTHIKDQLKILPLVCRLLDPKSACSSGSVEIVRDDGFGGRRISQHQGREGSRPGAIRPPHRSGNQMRPLTDGP